MEDARRGVIATRAAEPAERPFRQADGDAHDEQRDEVSDEEGPAARLGVGNQTGKSQEVTETDRAAGDSENHP